MLDILFVAGLATIAASLGKLALDVCGATFLARSDRLSLAALIGFGFLALAALGLGEIGQLHARGLGAVLSLGGVFAAWSILRGRTRGVRSGLFQFDTTSPVQLAFDACLGLTLAGTLLTALAPVTDGDALCYHLQVPKIFLHDGAVGFQPDLHETIYPLGVEMLYAIALAIRGPVACRLIQWVFGACLAGCVTALARPALGPRARWAGTIALLVPAVSNGMGAPLNDVALAAFGNAAIVAFFIWSDRPTLGRSVLVGLLAGMAIGVKYPALVLAGILGLGMVAKWPRPRRSGLGQILAFGVVAIGIGGWWYLRAYAHTGNPVFPFFRHVFGGSGIDEVLDPIKRPLPVSAWNLATAIGPMTLQPDRFDSLSHQFGPAFLLLLPGMFLIPTTRRTREIFLIGFAFLTLCLTQRQSMRFLLIAVGPMAVAVAEVASRWWDRGTRPGRWLVGLLALILAFEAAVAVGRARHGLGVVSGRETVAAYLNRREPTYQVGLWIDANLPKSARLIGQEHRGFYLPRPYAMELAHRRRTGLATHGETAGDLVRALREDGFTHLLLCPPEPETAVEFDPTLTRRLAPWLSNRDPLFRRPIIDPDGVTRNYAIYDLGDDPQLAHLQKDRR